MTYDKGFIGIDPPSWEMPTSLTGVEAFLGEQYFTLLIEYHSRYNIT